MAVEKVLMTAASGRKVWVPVDRLEDWKKAQADRSIEMRRENQTLTEKALSMLSQLSKEAQGKSV